MEQSDKKTKMREVAIRNLGNIKKRGRTFGAKGKKTIAKEIALQNLEQKLLYDVLGLAQSQMDVAHGISVMMVPVYAKSENEEGKTVWHRTGKFREETNRDRVIARLEDPEQENQEDYYYIYTERPNPKAIEDIMSRLFGRSRDKEPGGEDPFEQAFRNLFLNFTAHNTTVLVNAENNAADPTKEPRQIARPQPAPTYDPGSVDILERLQRAISKPRVEIKPPILD